MNGDVFFELIFGFFLKLIDLSSQLFDFLFYEISVLDLEISMWQILGGTAIIVLLVAWFIKKVVPVA